MAAKETDQREEYPSTFLEQDGTSLKAGLDVVRKFGAVLESELPWNGLAGGTPEAYYRSAKSRRIMAYFNLGDDSAADRTVHFAEWRKWLPQSGPVARPDRARPPHPHRAARHVRPRFGDRQPRRRAVRLRA